ncbi:MAG: DoxX family membrane protein [Candidatus Nanohaloarchaea archaeon]|nr:DoxX family membrane protein [Candidatus Nanohaloarchaea archaeon]
MTVQHVTDRLDEYSPYGYPVLRLGLGGMILLAGLHKLVRPTVWSAYMAPWAAGVVHAVGVPVNLFMQGNGVLEAVLGLAIAADRYTAIAAGLVSLSLLAISINMATLGTAFLDVLIRDLGLLALAVGVTLLAAGRQGEATAAER